MADTMRLCLRVPCQDDRDENLNKTLLSISSLPVIRHSKQASEELYTVKPTRNLEPFSILREGSDGYADKVAGQIRQTLLEISWLSTQQIVERFCFCCRAVFS